MNFSKVILRGISQIFLMCNPLSGALIIVAMSLYDVQAALFMLLGSISQTLSSWGQTRRTAWEQGGYGFNGALVGAATGVYVDSWLLGALYTVAGACACTLITFVLSHAFQTKAVRWAHLSVATAPFCIVAGLLIALVFPPPTAGQLTSGHGLAGVAYAVTNSFAEVILADGPGSGLLIMSALFLASCSLATYAVLGALVSLLISSVALGGLLEVSTGLYGYSSVLIAIAVRTLQKGDTGFLFALWSVPFAVVLVLLLQWVVAATPVPVLTWPFVLSLWLVQTVYGAITVRGVPQEQ